MILGGREMKKKLDPDIRKVLYSMREGELNNIKRSQRIVEMINAKLKEHDESEEEERK